MTDQQRAQLAALIDSLRPEARELVALAKSDPTTKDGYGVIYKFVSQLGKNTARALLIACVKEGYPQAAAEQIDALL